MASAFKRLYDVGHVGMTPQTSFVDILPLRNQSPGFQTEFPWLLNSAQRLNTYNGSAAIANVVRLEKLKRGDKVLLPAYCCGAELGPFRVAGCEILFFDVLADLSADLTHIDRQLHKHTDIKLLLVTHYFGFAQPEIRQIVAKCHRRKICVLEDCAHALYSSHNKKPLGSFGNYAIFSPRKSLPVTEGGICVSHDLHVPMITNGFQLPEPPLMPRLSRLLYAISQRERTRYPLNRPVQRLASTSLRILITPFAIILKAIKLTHLLTEDYWLTPDVEDLEAKPFYTVGISKNTKNIYAQTDSKLVISTRQNNFRQWLQESDTISEITPLINKLDNDTCPLYFPVYHEKPAELVKKLACQNIEAFNWWQYTPEELEALNPSQYTTALALKKSIVALPCHQQVTPDQIAFIANTIRNT